MTPKNTKRKTAGFTLVEILIAGGIVTVAMTCALGIFLTGMRTMYKDMQRLETNNTLRTFLADITKKSLDSTEFYLFPTYASFDGSIDITSSTPNTAPLVENSFGSMIARGDCLVLVSRLTTSASSNVRHIRIYYRATTSSETQAPLRFYAVDYGPSGTNASVQTLLNAINLAGNPEITGSKQMAKQAIGRLQGAGPSHYPIFATESPTSTPVFANVSVNVEIVNGTSSNNMLSSSSFNYIISPRK